MNFNQRVYILVSHIPPGKVLSYSRVAWLLDVPNAARAVGWALHSLPDNSTVPWQRVINAQGKISIRGRGNAAIEQRRLLESEGVQFDDAGRVKLDGPDGIMWLPSPWEVREIFEAAERIDKKAKRPTKRSS
jgi:methylated-DNA-protein-cysteine methyltransferase-like protein